MATLQETVVLRLAALTGNLEPTGQGSAKDLHLARRILAKALASQQTELLAISEVISGLAAADLATAQPRIVREDLASIVERSLIESAKEKPEFLVYRRELLVLTTQDPSSLPVLAAGHAIDRTLGPFRDSFGRFVWIDLFHIVLQVAPVRSKGGALRAICKISIQSLTISINPYDMNYFLKNEGLGIWSQAE